MALVDRTIAKTIEKGKIAPAPCSLENALKGICCKKGANARVKTCAEKKVCLLSRLKGDRIKRTFKRVQTHNGRTFFCVPKVVA